MFFQLKPPKCKSLRPIVATMNSKILGVWNYSRMVHDANAKLKYGKVIWQELWNLRLHHRIQSGGQANKIKKKRQGEVLHYLWYVHPFWNFTFGEDQATANTTVHVPFGSTHVDAETAAQIVSLVDDGMLEEELKFSLSNCPSFNKNDMSLTNQVSLNSKNQSDFLQRTMRRFNHVSTNFQIVIYIKNCRKKKHSYLHHYVPHILCRDIIFIGKSKIWQDCNSHILSLRCSNSKCYRRVIFCSSGMFPRILIQYSQKM